MTEGSSARNFVVVDLAAVHLSDAARLHLAAFPKSALTSLGVEAVRRYYEWLLVGPHQTTALGAFHGDQLIAFLFAGTFKGAMTGFLHRNRRYLALHLATHPWLVLTPLVRERITMALNLLRRRKRPPATPSAKQPAPTFGVLAIAVDPRWQGHGAGKALMLRAEQNARERGFDRIQLTVAAWNEQAIGFYLGSGWEKVLDGERWTGAMTKRLA